MRKYWVYLAFLQFFVNHPSTYAQTTGAPAKAGEFQIRSGPIPARVLLQSPSDTATELQIICLFTSETHNALHGSLAEINQKLHGLLDQIRRPTLFRGELGETLLIESRGGSIGAKRLMLIGLGDSQTFSPDRMELVGAIVYREASRMEIAHPYFAPTILDGGVTKFSTGEVSEAFIVGFLRGARTQQILKNAGAAQGKSPQDITYLAGPAHAADTQNGIEKGFGRAPK